MASAASTTRGPATSPSGAARAAYAVNAVVAWTGLVLTVAFSALGWYRETTPEPGLYGGHPGGAAGALARVVDTLSYFTIWSNVVVAVSVTMLLARPLGATTVRRVLRLAGLLMIVVTGIVYQVLLAPAADIQGWSRLTDPILHVLTPLLTVLVWLVWGPRGWVGGRTVLAAMLLPSAWIGWMLARGAVVDAYPYGFVNVVDVGYAAAAQTLAAIVLFGLLVAVVLWAVDVVLTRVAARRRA